MPELLTIEEAQARVLERVRPLAAERVSLDAGGRPCARVSRHARPSTCRRFRARRWTASRTRRGHARHASRSSRASPPGARRRGRWRRARRWRIATGGAVPEGADAVIPIEYVVVHGNEVEIPEAAAEGANVTPARRRRARGRRGRARRALASVRRRSAPWPRPASREVECARRPRVAVLATGTELRAPGSSRSRAGEIYESNAPLLAAALAGAGADVESLGTVEDDEEAHRDALERGLEADVLVTSGGVSVGPHDLVRRIERELGVEEVFWGVAVKPGKPLSFGVRGGTLVFGLPGNPVSSLVGFELFVRPALLALQGVPEPGPRSIWAAGDAGPPERRTGRARPSPQRPDGGRRGARAAGRARSRT